MLSRSEERGEDSSLNHHGLQAQNAVVLIVVVLYAYAVLLPLGGVDSCHT